MQSVGKNFLHVCCVFQNVGNDKDGTFAGGGGKERCVSEMEHHVVFHLVQVSRFCCTECDGIIPGGFKSHDQE